MDWLRLLTPAETLLILRPGSSYNELLRYTLMDQFFRETLVLTGFEPKPAQGRSNFRFARVVAGKNFMADKPKLHEMVFLFPFCRKPGAKIVVRHLMQMGLQASRSESNFKRMMRTDDPAMQPLFTNSFWARNFGGIKLSGEGRQVQKHLVEEFNRLDREVSELVKSDAARARDHLKAIRGNVLLMNSFKFDLIQVIGRELSKLEEELTGDTSVVPG